MPSDHTGMWQPVHVHYEGANIWPQQSDGLAHAGLVIVPAYDLESGCFWGWEIWHHETGIGLVEVRAEDQRLFDLASRFAQIADWESVRSRDLGIDGVLWMKVRAYAAGFPREVFPLDDLDELVPYR